MVEVLNKIMSIESTLRNKHPAKIAPQLCDLRHPECFQVLSHLGSQWLTGTGVLLFSHVIVYFLYCSLHLREITPQLCGLGHPEWFQVLSHPGSHWLTGIAYVLLFSSTDHLLDYSLHLREHLV